MTVPALNALDYVLIAIVLVSAIIGVFRGVVREVVSIGAWVLGIWAAWHYGSVVSQFAVHYVASSGLRLWLARLAILAAALITGALLAWIVKMLMHGAGLSGLDRLLGVVFGVVRGALIVMALIWTLRAAGLDNEPWCRESKLLPYAAPAMNQLRALV